MRRFTPFLTALVLLTGTAGCTAGEAGPLLAAVAQVLASPDGSETPTGPGGLPLPGASQAPGRTPPTLPRASAPAFPLPTLPSASAPAAAGAGSAPSAQERELYELILAYRAELGLPAIPLSPALTTVAQTHARDLQAHPPDKDAGCNMHSWSADGPWTPVCYTGDHAQAEGMWNKPKELTAYPGSGFEIAYGAWGTPTTPEGALEGWKSSSGHDAVMANRGSWADTTWQAVGAGMSENYAVVWFGKEPDPTR